MAVSTTAATVEEAAKMTVERVREISRNAGVLSLSEFPFCAEDVEKLAEQAMNDACTGANPKPVTKEDIIQVFMTAYNDAPVPAGAN